MALTQAMLKAMGIEDEKREQILDAHHAEIDSVKDERDQLKTENAVLKAEAEKVPDLQRQLEDAAKPAEDIFKPKYEELQREFEDFKAKVADERAAEEKRGLYRSLLRETGIDEKTIDAIVRVTDLEALKVEDGKIADSDSVKESVEREWAAFIPKETTKGADTPTPPTTGSTEAGADPETVRRLAERHERLYGKTEDKGVS